MKKFLLLTLALSMLLMSLVSCDMLGLGAETTEPLTEKTFSVDGRYSITLPLEFNSSSGSYKLNLYSEEHYIRVYNWDFSSITPNEGYSFPTLKQFFGESGVIGTVNIAQMGLQVAELFFCDREAELMLRLCQSKPKPAPGFRAPLGGKELLHADGGIARDQGRLITVIHGLFLVSI